MLHHQVNSSAEVEDPDVAWTYVREFGSDWHPDIISVTQSIDASGAVVREFTGSDGGNYREQRTYFSDTDRLLRYAMTDGIAGVEGYSGEASVLNNTVNWFCSFAAKNDIGSSVAIGSKAIFDNGLDWLKCNIRIPANKRQGRKKAGALKSNTTPQRETIAGLTELSVLTTVPTGQPCWTLVLLSLIHI